MTLDILNEDWPADDIDEDGDGIMHTLGEGGDPSLDWDLGVGQSGATNRAVYPDGVRNLVEQHEAAVREGDWSKCMQCVRDLTGSSRASRDICVLAMADMAAHMFRAASGSDSESTSSADPLAEGAWSERSAALREACASLAQGPMWGTVLEAAKSPLLTKGEGAGLVVAWALEASKESQDAMAEEQSVDMSAVGSFVGSLLMSHASLPAVRCAELVLSESPRVEASLPPPPSFPSSSPLSLPPSSTGLPPHVLECMVGLLAAQFEAIKVQESLRGFHSMGLGGGITGFVLRDKEGCPLECPPGLEEEWMIVPVPLGSGGSEQIRHRASAVWQEGASQAAVHLHKSGGGKMKRAKADEAVLIAVLQHLRSIMAAGRKEGLGGAGRAMGVGRALYTLIRGLEKGERLGGDVLGHVLPLCFMLLEEYERHQTQSLGLLCWLWAAHLTTPTELSWHLAISAKVMEHSLKVARHAPVLRVLLFAVAELLRLARPSDRQELERVRGAVLEEAMAAISRCTDQAQRFVLVEGLVRLVRLYAGGYLLVRWLRPLVQVLCQQLEDGDLHVRCASLCCLESVLRCCEPMVHAHALHTLAAVSRQALLCHALPSTTQAEQPSIAAARRRCVRVCVALRDACATTPEVPVDLIGFVRGLLDAGCPAVLQDLITAMEQPPEQPPLSPQHSVAVKSGGLSAPLGGSGKGTRGGKLIQEL